MRKPNQPNVAAALAVIQAQKNAHGVKSRQTTHTVSVKQEVRPAPKTTNFRGRAPRNNTPKLWGFIYQNKHIRFGLCFLAERHYSHV